ncbi:glycosyltransferase [Pseudanabaena sp. FACHB-2040]|uniref:glycosyltransferase n=1 Tax=Pseudanabaena sp. FACHB-2040 TaxID=2692859 RepID=UPI0016826AB4|nr:glycosyltransferase [Pseudanabaena sp. FACHB-2040]
MGSRQLPSSIIVLSTADWTQSGWTNNQHMAHELARQGFRVLYVESQGLRSPTASARDIKRIFRRLRKGLRLVRRVEPQVWAYSPLVLPFYHNPWIRRLNWSVLGGIVRLLSRLLRLQNPILWIYNPLAHELMGTLGESLTVYHCVDDLATVPGIDAKLVVPAELETVNKADVVFTTSPSLQARLAAIAPQKTHYFPNVADYGHFSKAQTPGKIPEDLATIAAPRIGFVGTIKDYKIDFDLIEQIAQARPEWAWVLIGAFEVAAPEALRERFSGLNVHFLGERPYGMLPDYLRGFDVVTLPCLLNDYTRSMFPMKFFEYLAAGKPIVATPLPALESYQGLHEVCSTSGKFISAIEEILVGESALKKQAMIAAAQENTWEGRCRGMLERLQGVWDNR